MTLLEGLLDCKKLTLLRYTIWSLMLNTVMASDNITSRFMMLDDEQLVKGRFIGAHRKPRFLTFQTTDTEIIVDMQLSVPFLTIPIKKTLEGANGVVDKLHSANLNVGALGLTSLMVFGSAILIPKILNFFSATHVEHNHDSFGRNLHDKMSWIDRLEDELASRGAPPRSCAGRIICWIVRRSLDASNNGDPNSSDKIIDGIASNEWIMKMMKDTIFQEAVSYGHNKQDCSSKYAECKISQNALENFIKAFSSKFFNN